MKARKTRRRNLSLKELKKKTFRNDEEVIQQKRKQENFERKDLMIDRLID